jgi:hypothetical protein
LYNNVVPISLYVSMEIVKVVVNYLVEQASPTTGRERPRTSPGMPRAASNMPPVPTKPLGSAFKLLAVRVIVSGK